MSGTDLKTHPLLLLCSVLTIIPTLSGCHCISVVNEAVPANRLPRHFLSEPKEPRVPVQLASLGQCKPQDHVIGAGDTLTVFIYGVFPSDGSETPLVQRTQQVNQRYYPPQGSIVGPATGLPVVVDGEGTIELPILGRINVAGLTVSELIEKLKADYREKKIVEKGRERILVTLLIPRVTRVAIIREDTPTPNVQLVNPGVVDHIHRGSGEVIDLPAYENDVLHALAATGGMPGTDAASEVWVFRNRCLAGPDGIMPDVIGLRDHYLAEGLPCDCADGSVIRIPLTTNCPGGPLPFGPGDVVLEEGDVVYVPRRAEYFYTGGLLKGGRIPLPRDEDIDVVEAIALATGSVGGPLGQSGQALATGNPGHMVRPTRVIIIRKLPDGRQLPIRVDLARAMTDEKQRIYIQKDDQIMLHFKPHEAVANGVLNIVTFTFLTGLNN